MVFAIICLGGLTLLVLIFESHWTSENGHHHSRQSHKNASRGNGCWLTEDFEVVKDCAPCTDFELASKSEPACIASGFKEILHCSISGKVLRGCDRVTWIDERNFWTFEALMFLAGIFSYSVVYVRQKMLDQEMLQRIQKQLARGV
ncbi:Hypothetical predicted protein [Cloeon dipterum]|uniref:Protein JTB n=1 Tax=Cloeon dipterum TaxID=197152 RepID=A0A8S1DSI9_9INSE|nr:Hypothetical predicted protein [Cloeon dipterum]